MSTLRILDDIVSMVGRVDALAGVIGRRHRELADQLRRASVSVGLNVAEGCMRGARSGCLVARIGRVGVEGTGHIGRR